MFRIPTLRSLSSRRDAVRPCFGDLALGSEQTWRASIRVGSAESSREDTRGDAKSIRAQTARHRVDERPSLANLASFDRTIESAGPSCGQATARPFQVSCLAGQRETSFGCGPGDLLYPSHFPIRRDQQAYYVDPESVCVTVQNNCITDNATARPRASGTPLPIWRAIDARSPWNSHESGMP